MSFSRARLDEAVVAAAAAAAVAAAVAFEGGRPLLGRASASSAGACSVVLPSEACWAPPSPVLLSSKSYSERSAALFSAVEEFASPSASELASASLSEFMTICCLRERVGCCAVLLAASPSMINSSISSVEVLALCRSGFFAYKQTIEYKTISRILKQIKLTCEFLDIFPSISVSSPHFFGGANCIAGGK